jgi:arylsulfatase A-like enzyme
MDVHDPFYPSNSYLKDLKQKPVSQWTMSRLAAKSNKKLDRSLITFTKEEMQTLINLYDAEIRYTDNALGCLINEIKEKDLLNETYIIITSDHGQEFWEHNGLFHTPFPHVKLYEELIHIPLIIFGPDINTNLINTQFSLMDIAPTILDLLNISNPVHFVGKSVLSLLKGSILSSSGIISEGISYRGEGKTYAYRTDNYKYILSIYEKEKEELYDLKNDSKEKTNIANTRIKKLKYFRAKILEHINREKHKFNYVKSGESILLTEEEDKIIKERLQKLGYI